MRRLGFLTALSGAVIAGLVAMLYAAFLNPARADANRRDLAATQAYAKGLSLPGWSRSTQCHGDGLVSCNWTSISMADAMVGMVSALDSTAQAVAHCSEIPSRVATGGRATECSLDLVLHGHHVAIILRPSVEGSHDGVPGVLIAIHAN
ncbi:MAG: hypothetical protein QOJ62_1506 [Actinomycetota bacterium]|jgi:hypothetical protein|nr:hypothetical protein [Actinomycetota bacterium]